MLKPYCGSVPACGAFCGGCPNYVRQRKPCPGAAFSERCQTCKSFHLCCQSRGIRHCHECSAFPCRRLRDFAERWKKYGQDFIANQRMLHELGEQQFLEHWNAQVEASAGADDTSGA